MLSELLMHRKSETGCQCRKSNSHIDLEGILTSGMEQQYLGRLDILIE